MPPPTLLWAAFFGDVEHQVLPVASGIRLTLTYNIFRDTCPDPLADALLLRSAAFRREPASSRMLCGAKTSCRTAAFWGGAASTCTRRPS